MAQSRYQISVSLTEEDYLNAIQIKQRENKSHNEIYMEGVKALSSVLEQKAQSNGQ